ncbi:MAG: phosphoglycerate kinase [Fidelibacterota bacterium]
MLKTLSSFDLKDQRILMRVDFNVPLENGQVVDDFRIRAVLPTIQTCLKAGAALILMSHLGRPKGKKVDDLSLIPVGETLADLLEQPIKFSHDCISEDAQEVSLGLSAGEVHLLENLRFHAGETENDPDFSSQLAKHGQIFINDAFGTAHRAHASNVGVTSYFTRKGIGSLIEKELHFLNQALQNPQRPLVLVLGGAKLGTKLKLIERFLYEADTILIGGGMAFTFLKSQGKNVGASLVDDTLLTAAHEILQSARQNGHDLRLPKDFVGAPSPDAPDQAQHYLADRIPSDMMGLDIGPLTVNDFRKVIEEAQTIVWNGPLGVFEKTGFDLGTREVVEALATAHKTGATTIVGGGDTAAAVRKYNFIEHMSHISTGGGASLKLLSGERLPALGALEQ